MTWLARRTASETCFDDVAWVFINRGCLFMFVYQNGLGAGEVFINTCL